MKVIEKYKLLILEKEKEKEVLKLAEGYIKEKII